MNDISDLLETIREPENRIEHVKIQCRFDAFVGRAGLGSRGRPLASLARIELEDPRTIHVVGA